MTIAYSVDTGYACAAVFVDEEGVVVDAAPIFHWMVGKKWEEVKGWRKIKAIYE